MKFSRTLSGTAVRTLRAAGLYYPVRKLYRRFKYEMFRHKLAPFKIRFMVLSVGQACNYKCKHCGNFAPYAPAEFLRYKLEDIISWMKQILEAVDSIGVLQIQGGEPFAYSDLGRLITSLSNFWGGGAGKITQIVIATNGSILPNDELLKILKDFDVEVRISDYNITPDKTKILLEALQKYGIRHYTYSFATQKGYWYDQGGLNIQDYPDCDEDTLNERFTHCSYQGCLTLERGRLAHCSRANNAPVLQGFEPFRGDYIVLSEYHSKHELRSALEEYYFAPKYMKACRYCYGSDSSRMIPPAVQIKG